MRYVTILALGLFIGCVGSQESEIAARQSALDPVSHSGTRLELRIRTITLTALDGATYIQRSNPFFFDTTLGHACDLTDRGSGLECLPASDLTVDGNYPGTSGLYSTGMSFPDPGFPFVWARQVFSDSSCTKRVAAMYDPSGSADPTKLFVRIYGDPNVYEVGSDVTSVLGRGTHYYYTTSTDPTCRYYSTTAFGLPVMWRLFEIGSIRYYGFVKMSRTEGEETLP